MDYTRFKDIHSDIDQLLENLYDELQVDNNKLKDENYELKEQNSKLKDEIDILKNKIQDMQSFN